MTSPGESLLEYTQNLPDEDIWTMAVGMVAIAGKRATEKKNWDINMACLKFVKEMATLVGTPSFPLKGSTQ